MKNYEYYLKRIGEYGFVEEIRYPIARVVGLPNARPQEIILFEEGQMGEVFSLNNETIEVLLLSKQPVKAGDQVTRTNTNVSVPVGNELLAQIINPLGRSFFDQRDFEEIKNVWEVDREVQGIATRKRIQRPFFTGISLVDLLIPLGKGQRQLVIGDRKTGKSSFLLTTVKNQIINGSIVVYAAIGKKKSDIKKLQEFFEREKINSSVVIVASDPFESPSLIFLTPYTAMSIAEFFRDQGRDVVVVFDDLSTHAKFYREVALLGGRFPGRDSYPGDIFHIHARLLERAGNFSHPEKKEVSITALPVAETVEGDLTGFISTNIMGMTDGHIFFDSDAFYKGRRPAINISLSVTRVGRQTQSALKRSLNREITAFLTNYEKMQSFSHFGAELSEKVKTILKTGEKLQLFFDQHYNVIMPEEIQLVLLSLIWLHALDEMTNEAIETLRSKLILAYQDEKQRKQLQDMVNVENFQDLLIKVGKNKEQFLKLIDKSQIPISNNQTSNKSQ